MQRIFAHRDVFAAFGERFLAAVAQLVVGDPMDPATDVGPLISSADADRVVTWIEEARRDGATLLAGGARRGNVVSPTVLTGTRPEMRVCAREAFAPLVVLEASEDVGGAIRAVDRSDYGLQAGIFTPDLATAQAYEGIEAGAVLVNEVPTWRSDPMPYGGTKGSGIGREGSRWAIEDYTEPRLLVLTP